MTSFLRALHLPATYTAVQEASHHIELTVCLPAVCTAVHSFEAIRSAAARLQASYTAVQTRAQVQVIFVGLPAACAAVQSSMSWGSADDASSSCLHGSSVQKEIEFESKLSSSYLHGSSVASTCQPGRVVSSSCLHGSSAVSNNVDVLVISSSCLHGSSVSDTILNVVMVSQFQVASTPTLKVLGTSQVGAKTQIAQALLGLPEKPFMVGMISKANAETALRISPHTRLGHFCEMGGGFSFDTAKIKRALSDMGDLDWKVVQQGLYRVQDFLFEPAKQQNAEKELNKAFKAHPELEVFLDGTDIIAKSGEFELLSWLHY